jgi:hypothetical protein
MSVRRGRPYLKLLRERKERETISEDSKGVEGDGGHFLRLNKGVEREGGHT